jgi:hypothetical protein
MIAILLIIYLKNKATSPWHFSNLAGFLRLNLFVKINLWKWTNKPLHEKHKSPPKQNLLFPA